MIQFGPTMIHKNMYKYKSYMYMAFRSDKNFWRTYIISALFVDKFVYTADLFSNVYIIKREGYCEF